MKAIKRYLTCNSEAANHIFYQLSMLFFVGLLFRIIYFLLAYQNYGGLEDNFKTCPESHGYSNDNDLCLPCS